MTVLQLTPYTEAEFFSFVTQYDVSWLATLTHYQTAPTNAPTTSKAMKTGENNDGTTQWKHEGTGGRGEEGNSKGEANNEPVITSQPTKLEVNMQSLSISKENISSNSSCFKAVSDNSSCSTSSSEEDTGRRLKHKGWCYSECPCHCDCNGRIRICTMYEDEINNKDQSCTDEICFCGGSTCHNDNDDINCDCCG